MRKHFSSINNNGKSKEEQFNMEQNGIALDGNKTSVFFNLNVCLMFTSADVSKFKISPFFVLNVEFCLIRC
jgi:hypothetical protein